MAKLIDDPSVLESLVSRIHDAKWSKVEGDRLISLRRNQVVKHKDINYNIARVMWQHHKKSDIPSSYTYQPTCGNLKCLKEEHLHFGFKGNPADKEGIKELMQSRSKVTHDGKCRVLECATNSLGYGTWIIDGKSHPLGRVIVWLSSEYERVTDLPSELVAGHLCRNLLCINLDHYELVTKLVNNYEHKIRDGTLIRGDSSNLSRITEQTAKSIIQSYRPKGHPEFMTGRARALRFGVSPANIYSIDSRKNWNHLPHPNGLSIPARKKRKTESEDDEMNCGLSICAEDLVKLHDRLKDLSQPTEEINQYTQTPCWLWKTATKNRPTISYKGKKAYASVIACYISSGRKPFDDAVARHKCGQSLCVHIDHLEWGSKQDNRDDMQIHGTKSKKLTVHDAREIRDSNEKGVDLAARFNVSTACISSIRSGHSWKEIESDESME